MNIKGLFFGSAIALLLISGARAADIISVMNKPKPVRVCDAYGQGYFYIPGTEICLRISGHIRGDIKAGNNIYAKQLSKLERNTYAWQSRAALRFQTASETELGTLRSFAELRAKWDYNPDSDGINDKINLHFAFIELGGWRVGLDESIFNYWTGYFGGVINDNVLNPLAYSRTNAISYTLTGNNGFSAILGLEQGTGKINRTGFRYNEEGKWKTHSLSQQIDGYTPHIIGGVKYAQGWGGISAVAAYDAYYSAFAAKARFDVNLNDRLSLWAMGGYKSMKDYYSLDDSHKKSQDGQSYTHIIHRQINSIYGDWGGHWAVWGGGTYTFTPQTSVNLQIAYEAANTFSSSVNLAHEIVPGLTITPELTYISWNDKYGYTSADGLRKSYTSLKGRNAFQAMVRLQRSF